MKAKRICASLLSAALIVMLFSACGKPADVPDETSKTPDVVTTPNTDFTENQTNQTVGTTVVDEVTNALINASWDIAPWKGSGSSGLIMWPHLYGTLLTAQEYGTLVEDMELHMAESVTFSEDKLTATVKIYDYITDSKGNSITADDVVFSYKTAPEKSGLFSHILNLTSIKAIDEYTVEMKVDSAGAGVWELILSYCPIVSQSWYESATDEEKSISPATTGAYDVVVSEPGVKVVMKARDPYWQKDELRSTHQLANVKTINFVNISENTVRTVAMENGEIDTTRIANTDMDRFINNENYNVVKFTQVNTQNLVFNVTEDSPFNNADLRRAVLSAIDFEQVRIANSGREDMGGTGSDVASTLCGNYQSEWDADPVYPYDLEKAKEYMIASGYGLNSGLKVRYLCRNIQDQLAPATVIQSYLAQIGIEMEITSYDQALYQTYCSDLSMWDMAYVAVTGNAGLVTDYWTYLFNQNSSGAAFNGAKDAKLQELLDAAVANNDTASLNAFRDYYVDMAYAANMFYQQGIIVSQPGIEDIYINFQGNALLSACTFAEDYETVLSGS